MPLPLPPVGGLVSVVFLTFMIVPLQHALASPPPPKPGCFLHPQLCITTSLSVVIPLMKVRSDI